jgi:hypothetical protein
MTRQSSLKRRIRARMARTGERYSTARRQVLKRLGNGDPPVATDQPEAAKARRRHPVWIGAVGLVLAVAVAGAVIVATQRSEGPADKGPSTASTSENQRSVSGSANQCRRVGDALARGVPLHLQAAGATPRDAIECLRLIETNVRELRPHVRELPPRQERVLGLIGREEGVREALSDLADGFLGAAIGGLFLAAWAEFRYTSRRFSPRMERILSQP